MMITMMSKTFNFQLLKKVESKQKNKNDILFVYHFFINILYILYMDWDKHSQTQKADGIKILKRASKQVEHVLDERERQEAALERELQYEEYPDTVEGKLEEQRRLLYKAARSGNLREVKRLIHTNESDIMKTLEDTHACTPPDHRCHEVESPMHAAAREGYHEIVEHLLANGAQAQEEDQFYTTPLYYATIQGLMSEGADRPGRKNYIKTIRHLLNTGIDPDGVQSPFFFDDSLDIPGNLDIPKELVSAGGTGISVRDIAMNAADRPGENHREQIYYMLNDAVPRDAIPPPEHAGGGRKRKAKRKPRRTRKRKPRRSRKRKPRRTRKRKPRRTRKRAQSSLKRKM